MIENLAWQLFPPYGFYFRVCFFQIKTGTIFTTSFSEVDGIGWTSESEMKTDSERKNQEMQSAVQCRRITLRSPLQPLPSLFEQWVNNHFNKTAATQGKGSIEAYDMVITLQSQAGIPIAAWLCSHAYPVGLSVSGINAESSGMATEKVILAYNRIERQL